MPTLTREALYELIWTDPVRTVAASFGVSDVWLRKVCVSLSVPVPERGYWAKLKAGKAVTRWKLPPREPGQSSYAEIGRSESSWRWDPEAELARPVPVEPAFPEPLEEVEARVAKRVRKVPYIRSLEEPWGTIRKLLEADDRLREKQREFASSSSFSFEFYKPLFASPFEQRRLRLLNSLCFGLARNGAKPSVGSGAARELGVLVGQSHVAFSFDHPLAKTDNFGRHTTRQGAVDTLKLEIKRPKDDDSYAHTFIDEEGRKLESRLTEIVIALIVAGEAQYRAASFAHYAWLRERRIQNQKEVERRRLEAERRAVEQKLKEEKERRDLLLSQAAAWRMAQDIRGFVTHVLAEGSSEEQRADVAVWAAWARTEADAIDPTKRPLATAPPSSAMDVDDEEDDDCDPYGEDLEP